MPLVSRVADGTDMSECFLARFIVAIAPTAECRKTCCRGRVPAELCKWATQTLVRLKREGKDQDWENRGVEKRAVGKKNKRSGAANSLVSPVLSFVVFGELELKSNPSSRKPRSNSFFSQRQRHGYSARRVWTMPPAFARSSRSFRAWRMWTASCTSIAPSCCASLGHTMHCSIPLGYARERAVRLSIAVLFIQIKTYRPQV